MSNRYICSQCGGRIDPTSMRCEYCGTQFEQNKDGIIRIETFENPVQTFRVTCEVSKRAIRELSADQLSEVYKHELLKGLSDCMLPAVQVEYEEDLLNDKVYVRGTLKAVIPKRDSI